MSDHVAESGSKAPDVRSSSTLGTGAASKRRRRGPSHGNPEKTPCVNCGRVPHRKCEHHLCPRCCNVVVKNCPVHIRKSDAKRGIHHLVSAADTPRNLTEAIDVYHNEMESVRHQYRWMYERKRMADAAELQQSIKRYKETNRWLSELLSSDSPLSIAKRNEEIAREVEKQHQAVMKRYNNLQTDKSRSLPDLECKKSSGPAHPPPENGKFHAKGGKDNGNDNNADDTMFSRSPSLSITPVSLPESEWLYILQHTAEKPAIQLRPS